MASAQEILNQFNANYCLDVAEMDDTHRDFLDLVHKAGIADKDEFATVFADLFEHTQAHFAGEETTMEQIQHSSRAEHVADHQRVLGDMDRFNKRVAAGRHAMARAWVSDSLLQWFHTHAQTMDSALAADIKASAA